ncbi:ATP-binding protein [Streptomyces sp. NPDC094034]|uniref:ATP-binding protein n=1 Tax=Streptomyces sp. NPDC094034 TaxID=3155309 RepID=UPI00333283AE
MAEDRQPARPLPVDWGLPMGLGVPPFTAHRFTATSGALRGARDFTRHTLRSWGLARRADDAVSIANELVANAMRHVLAKQLGQTGWLALTNSRHTVLCVVSDPCPHAPRLISTNHLTLHGRGLHIVRALSDNWGCHIDENDTGKTVWARISTR